MIQAATQTYNGRQIATFLHDAGGKNIVIYCHGYRGTAVGPSRFFVRVAAKLGEQGISSLRFDQFGSGNSDGDFMASSFNDWVATTAAIAADYQVRGYRVALLGQSMGGAAVITVGASLPALVALVAWVPDPNVDAFSPPSSGYVEEGGQRVQAAYWQEAHAANIVGSLAALRASAYIVQCTADEYIDQANRDAIAAHARPHHTVETFEGYPHSSWTYDQAEGVITKSAAFLAKAFGK